jgi:hypothetical protein
MITMGIGRFLILNICFLAVLGWWAAFRFASMEQDHTHIAHIPDPQLLQESFPHDEPFVMTETFDTVYFDGYTEEPMTR